MNFKELPLPALQENRASEEDVRKFIAAINNFNSFETARLLIRPFHSQDALSIHQILGPPEVHKWNYLFKNGFSLQDAEKYVQTRLNDQTVGAGIGLIFEDKETKSVLGELHADFDTALLAADIGYATRYGSQTQGKGFATEAAKAFLAALCNIGLQHIILTAAPNNTPSHKVIAKLDIPQVQDVVLQVTDADGVVHPRHLFYSHAQHWSSSNP